MRRRHTGAGQRHADRPHLTWQDINGLVDWMLSEGRSRGGKPGSGLSARSVQLTLSRLRAAFLLALTRQLVVRNVAAFVTIPRSATKAAAEAKGQRTPWTETEVKAFLVGIKGERLHAPLLLSLMGLRPAEVCGLRWSDVDFEAATIAVGQHPHDRRRPGRGEARQVRQRQPRPAAARCGADRVEGVQGEAGGRAARRR